MSLSSWFDPISAGLTLLAGLLLPAATGGDPAPKALDDAARERVVERVLEELERGYVYPEVAARMEEDVRARLARGEYAALSQPEAFARALTEHLQGVSKDKHLRVRWSARPLPQRPDREPGPAEMTAMRERRRAEEARRNFGFERVERLSGNIGYLDLRGFLPPEIMGPTADAAFAFLGHTDALIVDLRKNGGGAPEGVAYVSSFLFGEEPVHLNDLYFRPEDRTEEFWTRDVPGPRFEGKDVYVLTSSHTFSGAEEFAYNLKCLKRGTIVGERTGGGANPGGMERIDDHFSVFVPTGRAINPITKTNWEGVGVEPDVETPADKALDQARLMALDKAIDAQSDAELRDALIGERNRVAGQLGIGATR